MILSAPVRRTCLVLCVVALAAPAHAWFGNEPDVWLEQMEKALESVNYRGTFVYIHDDQAETMLVYHKVSEKGTQERLVSLNGSAREVLRNDDEVKCILPDDKAVFVEKRHPRSTLTRGVPLNVARYGDYYEFQLHGTGRIAGHTSRLVTIQPRDAYRYGYRLWLDEDTALPLRSELVNDNGQPIEKMMFTEIEIGAELDDELLHSSVATDDYTWHTRGGNDERVVDEDTPVKFESLPPGYRITRAEQRHEAGRPSWHLVLSDGLASVSVFAEPWEEGKPSLEGLSRMGAVNAFGARLPTHQITVVGEVPEATVAAIGEAVRFPDQ